MAISFIRSLHVGAVCLTMLVFLLVASSCGTGNAPESAAPETRAASEATAKTGAATMSEITVEEEAVSTERAQEKALQNCPKVNDALVEDAQTYAEDYGVSEEQAISRARLQNCFANRLAKLESELRTQERDSFAGLWIEHEPEYRFVVLFTEKRYCQMLWIGFSSHAATFSSLSSTNSPFLNVTPALTKATR